MLFASLFFVSLPEATIMETPLSDQLTNTLNHLEGGLAEVENFLSNPKQSGTFYELDTPFFSLSKRLHDTFGEPRRTWERWLICFTQNPTHPISLEDTGRRCHFDLSLQQKALRFLEDEEELIILPDCQGKGQGRLKIYFRDLQLADQVIGERGARFETWVISQLAKSGKPLAYWQNTKKQEVDVVLMEDEKIVGGLELKASTKVGKNSLKPLEIFTGTFQLKRNQTAVLYLGENKERAGFHHWNPWL